MKMYRLLLFTVLLGTGLTCSCVPGSESRSRSSTICDDFSSSSNVFAVTVQDIYCKCLVTENVRNRFSCIKYVPDENGAVSGEAQETFYCNSTEVNYNYLECNVVSEIIESQTVDPIVVSPETNLTDSENCGLDYSDPSGNNGSECDITHQPCYYTVNVTRVYKGNYTVGSIMSAVGPDVLTSCGSINRILKTGREYIVGIGSVCSPISAWSMIDVYNADDLTLLQQASTDPTVCAGAASIVALYSITVLLVVVLVTTSLLL